MTASEIDDALRVRIATALNTGSSVEDVRLELGLPRRVVAAVDRTRHVFRQAHAPEGTGRVLHAVAEERWQDRPQRKLDEGRRRQAKAQRDELLRSHGLEPRRETIIVPGAAPNKRGGWHSQGKRGAKAQRTRAAIEKAGNAPSKQCAVKSFSDYDDNGH